MGKRLLAGIVGIAALVALVVLVRTVALSPAVTTASEASPRNVDLDGAARRLSEGLRFRTISFGRGEPVPADAFRALHAHLERSFPRTHATLERELVGDYSLLYRWPGRDDSLKPALLMAHQDVVPVDEADWQHPPFGGDVVDGEVWGRGAIDDKGALYAILEAVELLLSEGFQPDRSFYLFFGHDEEQGGSDGAAPAAELLASRGVELAFVLDEGGFVVDRVMPGATSPIALVGIAEKGSVTYTLSVEQPGGHSSMPPRHSSIGILAEAVTRLEANPMPGGIDDLTGEFLVSIAPELPFPARATLANLWLFRPLVEAVMASSPPLDAMQRSTTAVTMVSGGVKSNVLPSRAEVTVNFRIRPGDTADDIRSHIERTVDDERIQITRGDWSRQASPASPTGAPTFEWLRARIGESFPGVPVVPYTVIGGTDSRHFYPLTPNVYRFGPFQFDSGASALVHGTDERIAVSQLRTAIDFYARLIEGSDSPPD
jgi:carboxypeptidase PM20D1